MVGPDSGDLARLEDKYPGLTYCQGNCEYEPELRSGRILPPVHRRAIAAETASELSGALRAR
jgi:hypothetical protein